MSNFTTLASLNLKKGMGTQKGNGVASTPSLDSVMGRQDRLINEFKSLSQSLKARVPVFNAREKSLADEGQALVRDQKGYQLFVGAKQQSLAAQAKQLEKEAAKAQADFRARLATLSGDPMAIEAYTRDAKAWQDGFRMKLTKLQEAEKQSKAEADAKLGRLQGRDKELKSRVAEQKAERARLLEQQARLGQVTGAIRETTPDSIIAKLVELDKQGKSKEARRIAQTYFQEAVNQLPYDMWHLVGATQYMQPVTVPVRTSGEEVQYGGMQTRDTKVGTPMSKATALNMAAQTLGTRDPKTLSVIARYTDSPTKTEVKLSRLPARLIDIVAAANSRQKYFIGPAGKQVETAEALKMAKKMFDADTAKELGRIVKINPAQLPTVDQEWRWNEDSGGLNGVSDTSKIVQKWEYKKDPQNWKVGPGQYLLERISQGLFNPVSTIDDYSRAVVGLDTTADQLPAYQQVARVGGDFLVGMAGTPGALGQSLKAGLLTKGSFQLRKAAAMTAMREVSSHSADTLLKGTADDFARFMSQGMAKEFVNEVGEEVPDYLSAVKRVQQQRNLSFSDAVAVVNRDYLNSLSSFEWADPKAKMAVGDRLNAALNQISLLVGGTQLMLQAPSVKRNVVASKFGLDAKALTNADVQKLAELSDGIDVLKKGMSQTELKGAYQRLGGWFLEGKEILARTGKSQEVAAKATLPAAPQSVVTKPQTVTVDAAPQKVAQTPQPEHVKSGNPAVSAPQVVALGLPHESELEAYAPTVATPSAQPSPEVQIEASNDASVSTPQPSWSKQGSPLTTPKITQDASAKIQAVVTGVNPVGATIQIPVSQARAGGVQPADAGLARAVVNGADAVKTTPSQTPGPHPDVLFMKRGEGADYVVRASIEPGVAGEKGGLQVISLKKVPSAREVKAAPVEVESKPYGAVVGEGGIRIKVDGKPYVLTGAAQRAYQAAKTDLNTRRANARGTAERVATLQSQAQQGFVSQLRRIVGKGGPATAGVGRTGKTDLGFVSEPDASGDSRSSDPALRPGANPNDAKRSLQHVIDSFGNTVLGRAFSVEMAKRGTANLQNRRVRNMKSLATLAQIYRDPRIETGRIIFMKGRKVVGETAVSARLVGGSAFAASGYDFLQFYEMYKEKFGADSFYLLHNHPSGDPIASDRDIATTREICEALGSRVAQFRGHVIVNSQHYGFLRYIPESGQIDSGTGMLKKEVDLLLRPDVQHDLLGTTILTNGNELQRIAQFGKQLQSDSSTPLLIGLSSAGDCRFLASVGGELRDQMLGHDRRAIPSIQKLKRENGILNLFVVIPDGMKVDGQRIALYRKLVEHGILAGIVDLGKTAGDSSSFPFEVTPPHSEYRRAEQDRQAEFGYRPKYVEGRRARGIRYREIAKD